MTYQAMAVEYQDVTLGEDFLGGIARYPPGGSRRWIRGSSLRITKDPFHTWIPGAGNYRAGTYTIRICQFIAKSLIPLMVSRNVPPGS